MTPSNFLIWLDGYLEGNETVSTEIVKRKLSEVNEPVKLVPWSPPPSVPYTSPYRPYPYDIWYTSDSATDLTFGGMKVS